MPIQKDDPYALMVPKWIGDAERKAIRPKVDGTMALTTETMVASTAAVAVVAFIVAVWEVVVVSKRREGRKQMARYMNL